MSENTYYASQGQLNDQKQVLLDGINDEIRRQADQAERFEQIREHHRETPITRRLEEFAVKRNMQVMANYVNLSGQEVT